MFKSLLGLLLIFVINGKAFSQQVYEISCKLDANTVYQGLLIRQADNTGFIRFSGKDGAIYDFRWKATQLYDRGKSRNVGPIIYSPATRDSFLYSKAIRCRIGAAHRNEAFLSIPIWFKKNKANGNFEPYTGALPFNIVSQSMWDSWEFIMMQSNKQTAEASLDENPLSAGKLLSKKSFEKNWLTKFFSADELTAASSFTSAQLVAARNKNIPVFYLVSVNGADELCRKDVDDITDYFWELTNFMGVEIRKTVIRGNDFNVTTITRKTAAIKPGPNDVVIFTYSGHGFSYQEDEQHQFPQLALWQGDAKSKDFLRANTINLEDIFNMIVAKKAKVNIVMGDCCNSFINMKREIAHPEGAGVFPPIDRFWDMNKLCNLFLDNPKSLLIAAAQKGEVAGSHDWFGGFFTFCFLRTLNESVVENSPANPAWATILATTKTMTYDKSKEYACGNVVCGQRMISKVGK